MSDAEIAAMKEKFASDIKAIMRELETACPGIINKDLVIYLSEDQKRQIIEALANAQQQAETSSDGMASGAAAGAGTSYVLLGLLGTSGFSAAGLTSGLAALGLGFGMIGGIFVIPAIIFTAMLWNKNSQKQKKLNKLRHSLENAVSRLYDIKIQLSRHEDIFSAQLETVNIFLDAFKTVLAKLDKN